MARVRLIKQGVLIGIIGFAVGIIPTMFAMTRAFQSMAASDDQAVPAEQLSADISESIQWSLMAMPIMGVGLIMFVMGVVLRPKECAGPSDEVTEGDWRH